MRWRAWICPFLLGLLSACDDLPIYSDDRSNPVAAAQGFVAAARRGDCDQTWTYFTPEIQAKIEEQSKRMIRGAPYYSETFAPHRIHCTFYESYRPSTVRLISRDSAQARVRVLERVPDPNSFSLPGWSPIGRMNAERRLNLSLASDGWKVVPPVPEDPRAKYGEVTYDIGRAVVVTRPAKQRADGSMSFHVEATMTMDPTPADIEGVLADPTQWPRFWPKIFSARWLGPEDKYATRHLAVVFDLPQGPREARVFFQQSGRTAASRAFSFGFGPEHLYLPRPKPDPADSERVRWAATFSATAGNPRGANVRWSQSISDARLAHQDLAAALLEAIEREAKRLSGATAPP